MVISGFETCILTNTTLLNADEATNTCDAAGASLPIISSSSQAQMLQDFLVAQGLTADVWLDPDSSLQQQLCFAADPALLDSLTNCQDLNLQPANSFMTKVTNADCDTNNKYAICQRPRQEDGGSGKGRRRDGCPREFFAYGSQCYWVSSGRVNLSRAARLCRRRNADLAQPVNETELQELSHFLADIGRRDGWLGLRLNPNPDQNGDLCAHWLNGQPLLLSQARRLGMRLFCPALLIGSGGTPRLRYRDCANALSAACATPASQENP